MTALVLALVLLGAAAGAGWLLLDLRTVPDAARRDARSVSVVVPARNEAAVVPTLLRSLAFLNSRPGQVVVVDDGSRDATASVARAAGATVVALTGPPSGWTGKAWACQRGADSTDGDLLLFLDADTELAPGALDGLLELHHRHGGLVSVQPYHQVERPYEQLSSYFNAVSLLASAAFAPGSTRRPMAFGPCLLTSRVDYERAGGHAAVRGEILDDVRLAAAYHRAGLPVRCAIGGGSIRMRSYTGGLRQLAAGWTKNFASGASAASPGPCLAVSVWVAAHHAVAVGAALAVAEVATGHRPGTALGPPLLWAVAWVGTALQLRAVLARVGSFGWWTWAVFPASLIAFDVLFARSVGHTVLRRSVQWRGREVPLAARRAGSERS